MKYICYAGVSWLILKREFSSNLFCTDLLFLCEKDLNKCFNSKPYHLYYVQSAMLSDSDIL